MIGFYKWLDADDVKAARALDPINSRNVQNDPGKGFLFDDVDASIYKGCSHFLDSYIVVRQKRNKDFHNEGGFEDPVKRMGIIRSLFIVYLDQCIRNQRIINEAFEKEFLSKSVDFVKWAKQEAANSKAFEKGFLQLMWYDENNEQFEYDFNSCVKFVGEAGTGKTTQMRKMYYNMLRLVTNKELTVLPVWIDLFEMSEIQDYSLEDKIKEKLGEYEQYYSLLLRKNVIALFLDGYNEIITKDMQDAVRRKLASDIDKIHTEYPNTLIAMTDRGTKSIAPCLTKNVKIFKYNGLTRSEIIEYVSLKTDKESRAAILNYLGSDSSAWIGNVKIIPAKVNSIIELVCEGIIPSGEDDFYDKYLDFILEREEVEKKETRIEDLRYLLYLLAQKLESPTDEFNKQEIITLWLNEGQVGDLSEARRLLKLALELPVLVPGSNDRMLKFAYTQYYHKMYEGL